MTHIYLFILGRKALLSIAELVSVLPQDAHILDIQREALTVHLPEPLHSPQQTLDRLGGTIKIARLFHELPSKEVNTAKGASVADAAANFLSQTFPNPSGKLAYGISLYSVSQKDDEILKNVLGGVKKRLKAQNISSRYINKSFKNPPGAAIQGEKLVPKSPNQPGQGAEIVMVQGQHKTFLGQTVALQDFESYSYRDFNRPQRDAKLGMLPPKVAQIMLNLSGLSSLNAQASGGSAAASHPHITIYDPFCGMGTVLTEALIMGYSVIGSDIDASVVEKAKKNIEFTQQNAWTKDQNIHLFAGDATNKADIEKGLLQANKTSTPSPTQNSSAKPLPTNTPFIRAVVTESYLGPPKSKFPGAEIARKTFSHTSQLVGGFLRAIHPLLSKDTPLVISIPVYRDGQKLHFFDDYMGQSPSFSTSSSNSTSAFAELAQKNGFAASSLLPKELLQKFSIPCPKPTALVYDRPDQVVGREIWKLVAK